ncbi:MAG: 50S ribosomal protein L13 [archaeon]|nr:MAG: 50S ribosomal protein L13 [archaeon]
MLHDRRVIKGKPEGGKNKNFWVKILDKVIDATDHILGRISSRIAKELLEGNKIVVINAGMAVITGNPKLTVENFRIKNRRGDPHHGPYYPKTITGIFKRSVRGMVPYKKAKGREALKRLSVYSDNPKKLKGNKEGKNISNLECRYITLADVAKKLGGK